MLSYVIRCFFSIIDKLKMLVMKYLEYQTGWSMFSIMYCILVVTFLPLLWSVMDLLVDMMFVTSFGLKNECMVDSLSSRIQRVRSRLCSSISKQISFWNHHHCALEMLSSFPSDSYLLLSLICTTDKLALTCLLILIF